MNYWSSVVIIAALIACGAKKDTQPENEDSTYDHQSKADSIKIPPDEVVIAGSDSLPFVFAPRIENGWGSSIYTPPGRAPDLLRSYEALLKEDPHVADETWVRVKSGGHGVDGLYGSLVIDRRSLKIGEKENVSDYGDEEPTEE